MFHPLYGTFHVDIAACSFVKYTKHSPIYPEAISLRLRIPLYAVSVFRVSVGCIFSSVSSVCKCIIITCRIFPCHLSNLPHSQCILQYKAVRRSAANGLISSRGWCKDIHHVGLQEIALRCWPIADVVADTNNKVCRGPKSHYRLHMAPVFWRNWHLLPRVCVGISRHVLLFGVLCLKMSTCCKRWN